MSTLSRTRTTVGPSTHLIDVLKGRIILGALRRRRRRRTSAGLRGTCRHRDSCLRNKCRIRLINGSDSMRAIGNRSGVQPCRCNRADGSVSARHAIDSPRNRCSGRAELLLAALRNGRRHRSDRNRSGRRRSCRSSRRRLACATSASRENCRAADSQHSRDD